MKGFGCGQSLVSKWQSAVLIALCGAAMTAVDIPLPALSAAPPGIPSPALSAAPAGMRLPAAQPDSQAHHL